MDDALRKVSALANGNGSAVYRTPPPPRTRILSSGGGASTVWGGRLSKRFCNKFSGSFPCLLWQHGSCSSAQPPVELSKNMLQNLFLDLPPRLYCGCRDCRSSTAKPIKKRPKRAAFASAGRANGKSRLWAPRAAAAIHYQDVAHNQLAALLRVRVR